MIIRNESGARWLPTRIADFEKWQASLLEESARHLDAVLDPGGRVHRYGFVGSPVTFRGQRAWLRVSPFLAHEMSRKAWRGTAEAAAISGVSKPALLHRIEWHADGPEPVPGSAEVLTLVTDPARRHGPPATQGLIQQKLLTWTPRSFRSSSSRLSGSPSALLHRGPPPD
jgi:hypothetical protein